MAGVAKDRDGNYFIAGHTRSSDLPATGFQAAMGGSNLARLGGGNYTMLRTPRPGLSDCVAAGWRNPGLLFVSTDSRIYRSADGGTTWSGPLAGLPGDGVCTSVAMDAAESGLVYASFRNGANGSLYRSVDNGATWVAVGSTGMGSIARVLVDPFDSAHVVVLAGAATWMSSDSGAHWQEIAKIFFRAVFDGGRQGIVFGIAALDGKVYRSADGGATWSVVGPLPGAWDIAPDPNRAGTVYATAQGSVYRSGDDGQTWEQAADSPYSLGLLIDPRNSSVYVSSDNLLSRTDDGGATWTPVGRAQAGVRQYVLAPDPANPAGAAVIYLGREADVDAYVAKYSPAGQLIWVTYLGGAGVDDATAIAVDSQGAVYAGGTTTSGQFPLTGGNWILPSGSGDAGLFVVKLSGDGKQLLYSSIPERVSNQSGLAGLAVDAQGSACAAFWNTVGHASMIGVPILGSFVAKLNPDGSAVTWLTDLSGGGQVNALALDAAGTAWVSGGAALWKVDSKGNASVAFGSPWGSIGTVALDATGRPVIAGTGHTTVGSLPLSSNAFQSTAPGYSPPGWGYIAIVDPGSGSVAAATLLAGEAVDVPAALGVDSQGRIIAGGSTLSASFPTRRPVQGPFNAATGFLARLNADLSDADVSTYAGDRRTFAVTGLTVDSDDNVVFVGNTMEQSNGEATGAFLAQLKIDKPAGDLRLDAVLNAGSRLASPVAPGEVVALAGDSFREDARVFFDDTPGEVAFRNWKEIRAVAPADLAEKTETRVRVEAGGQVSGSILMPVAAASPGIYTSAGLGWTFALAWDASGAQVLPQSPARAGTEVVMAVNGVPPGIPVTVMANSFYPVQVLSTEWNTRPDLPGAALVRLSLAGDLGPLPPFLSVAVPGAPPSRLVPLAVVP